MLELGPFRGTLSLLGEGLKTHISRLAPGANMEPLIPHITVINKHEAQRLNFDVEAKVDISLESLQILSLGHSKDVEYLTVCWAHAQLFRKKFGLEPKAFHITISKNDRHDICKDITTTSGGYPAFLRMFRALPESAMDFILADLLVNSWQQDLCFEFLTKFPTSYRALIRLADHTHDRPHISTNAYARALYFNPALYDYIARKIRILAPFARCGPFQVERQEQLPNSLLFPWPQEARNAVRELISECPAETRIHVRYFTEKNDFARFFSMPLPYRLAGMSTPRNEEDIDMLQRLGITRVLTLTEESPLEPSWFEFKRITNLFIPTPNYKPPTIAEMDYIYQLFYDDSEGFWLVHCGGGKGRAGTVLACLLAMHGSEDGTPQMDKSQVIDHLRRIRPGSIETSHQEDFVAAWISHRWKISQQSEKIVEPYNSLTLEVNPKLFPVAITSSNLKFIMLVGLPGSGKSFVAESIAARRVGETIIVSQDESGSRSACETQIQGNYRDGTLIILDLCNPDPVDRKYWLSLLMSTSQTLCIHFDYDMDLCLQRIDGRLNHPTIKAGRGKNALKQMHKMMKTPTLSEGFGAIMTISSYNAAKEAVMKLGGTVFITKFPRTSHLINLGASTDDDIVQDDWKNNLKGNLVIEEKIDGANMGFSLDYDGKLLVQNRSHYINHTSHAQFKPLAVWLAKHTQTLTTLLALDPNFPERYILYGEWVVAKHSLPYTSLPDVFLAFDFYDRKKKRFVSREYLERMLSGTGISQVPLILKTNEVSRETLVGLVETKSAFYEGRVEGVYIRFEDEKRSLTLDRGKIVRSDFIAGNEHWTKAETQLNGLTISVE